MPLLCVKLGLERWMLVRESALIKWRYSSSSSLFFLSRGQWKTVPETISQSYLTSSPSCLTRVLCIRRALVWVSRSLCVYVCVRVCLKEIVDVRARVAGEREPPRRVATGRDRRVHARRPCNTVSLRESYYFFFFYSQLWHSWRRSGSADRTGLARSRF